MSIQIGTNFDLKSKQFLDSRQGLPETKEDLLGWITPVPPGFEVCLGEEWYYYDPNVTIPDTGHWIPRLVGGTEIANSGENIVGGENRGVTADAVNQINTSIWTEINNINSRLDAEADAAAGYKIDNIKWGGPSGKSSGYTLEVGGTVSALYDGTPTISFNITGKNNYSYPVSGYLFYNEGVEESYTRNVSNDNVSKRISYNFITPTNNSMTLSANATLNWTYYRFWGTVNGGNKTILLNGGSAGYEVLRSFGNENRELSTSSSIEKSFNCTGGKYPVFAFYSTSNSWTPSRVKVGGLDNSNYSIYTVNMINTYEINISYHIFMLNQIQTGDNIEINIG